MIELIIRFVFAGVLGACFGSFVNVLAIRMHSESSLLGRSKCPACSAPIRPQHLVPVLSWLALRGACADCGAKIHIQYPLVEVAGACLAVIAMSRYGSLASISFYAELFLSLGLLTMVVMDFRWQELPLELMAVIGVIGAVIRIVFLGDGGTMLAELRLIGIALIVAICFFGIQWLVSRGKWLGSGDVWFAAMMAGILGWPLTGIAMYLAYLVGGSIVLILFILRVVKRGMRVPFAPALALGTLLALWFGQSIQMWITYAFAS
ncbi:MAG: prepilin peptidase [Patescibacteria group bacterium]